jgi:hypothetical protein
MNLVQNNNIERNTLSLKFLELYSLKFDINDVSGVGSIPVFRWLSWRRIFTLVFTTLMAAVLIKIDSPWTKSLEFGIKTI